MCERNFLYTCGKAYQGAIVQIQVVRMVRNAKTKYGREKIVPFLNSEHAKWPHSVKKLSGKSSKPTITITDNRGRLLGSRAVNTFLTSICTIFPLLTPQENEHLLEDDPHEGLIELSELDMYKELRKIKTGVSPFPGEIPANLWSGLKYIVTY